MAARLISDELWQQVETVFPPRPPRPAGGRPPIGDREVLTGVLFVLKTGIPWEDLPDEMGCGCGMTCLRRLRQWQQDNVWRRIEKILKEHLRDSSRYDWARAYDIRKVSYRLPRPDLDQVQRSGLRSLQVLSGEPTGGPEKLRRAQSS